MPGWIKGPATWSMERDTEGHRTYKIKFKVETDFTEEGPATVLATPGLPLPGSPWQFDLDFDPWARCLNDIRITPRVENEPGWDWEVEFTFTTKSPIRCQDEKIEDPLLEPARISGQFSKDKEEATHDRFGKPICSSSWEQFRGPVVEFDVSRHQITIEQNVPTFLQAAVLPSQMKDCVNDTSLWGFARRCIKLSNVSWERKFHGLCYKYYTRKLEFEVNTNTWDRDVLDEGNKVLSGRWNRSATEGALDEWLLVEINGQEPDRFNPTHFIRFTDRNGQSCRVILNGQGLPAGVVTPLGFYQFLADNRTNNANLNRPLTNRQYWRPYTEIEVETLETYPPGVGPDRISNAVEAGRYYYYAPAQNPFLIPPFNPAPTIWYAERSQQGRSEIFDIPGGYPPLVHPVNGPPDTASPAVPEHVAWVKSMWTPIGGWGEDLFYTGVTDFTDRGPWSPTTTYSNGDIVQATTVAQATAGSVHIEKYPQVNFILLGIPLVM